MPSMSEILNMDQDNQFLNKLDTQFRHSIKTESIVPLKASSSAQESFKDSNMPSSRFEDDDLVINEKIKTKNRNKQSVQSNPNF